MIDLKELERRLDKALAKETKDSLNSWLNSQRIDDLEKMDWDPYSREVAPICNSDLGMNLIGDYTNYYPPPLPKQKNKMTKKDSVMTTESFFFIIIAL